MSRAGAFQKPPCDEGTLHFIFKKSVRRFSFGPLYQSACLNGLPHLGVGRDRGKQLPVRFGRSTFRSPQDRHHSGPGVDGATAGSTWGGGSKAQRVVPKGRLKIASIHVLNEARIISLKSFHQDPFSVRCAGAFVYTATLNLIASFGAWTRSCFVPRYRSVV